MSNKKFRTRLAPSPTGYLHLGTARTALFSKLFALSNDGDGGSCFFRLEDTDQNRLIPAAAKDLLHELTWLGIGFDEGLTVDSKNSNEEPDPVYGVYQHGAFGPYIQSQRLNLYHTHAEKLLQKKLAYWCYLTDDQREELQNLKQVTKRPINYFQANLDNGKTEDQLQLDFHTARNLPNPPVLRYKLQRPEKITTFDLLLGKTEFDLALEEDFIVLKSDGFPIYHLAHLVDDYLMETNLVTRSQEWYASLPKHVTMFRDYWSDVELKFTSENGKNVPNYLHFPFILNQTGNKKMSKRDGNVNMQDYRQQGYLPEAMMNYLAFLGWNPGTDKELYLQPSDFQNSNTTERLNKLLINLAADFNLENLSKSPARFNQQKLDWFNKEYLKMLSLTEFVDSAKSLLNQPKQDISNFEYAAYLLDKNRITTLNQLGMESDCVLNYARPEAEQLTWKKITTEESLANLQLISGFILETWPQFASLQEDLISAILQENAGEKFESCCNWWEQKIKSWLQENEHQVGNFLWPLRVCLSGKTQSPSPFELLALLPEKEVVERLKNF